MVTTMSVLQDYVTRAMARACYERIEGDRLAGSIPGLRGVWADGATRDECEQTLREVLEEWLVAALRDDEELPEFDGVTLNFAGKRWSDPSRAASS
jgi:predicted RNase H-like HicB family nuclease